MKERRHSTQSIADSTPADSHWRRHYMCYLAGEKWCQMGNENKNTWKSSTFLFSLKPGLLIQLGYYSSEIYVIWSKTDDILPKSLYPTSFEIMTILTGTDNHYRALPVRKWNSHIFSCRGGNVTSLRESCEPVPLTLGGTQTTVIYDPNKVMVLLALRRKSLKISVENSP